MKALRSILCTELRRGKVDILGHDSRAPARIHLDHYKQFDYRRKEQLCNVLVLMQGSWRGSSNIVQVQCLSDHDNPCLSYLEYDVKEGSDFDFTYSRGLRVLRIDVYI